MRLLFKLSVVAVLCGSVFFILLLCGVFADSFLLPFPRWVRFGILASILGFGLSALVAGLFLWPRKSRHDCSIDPPPHPKVES